VRHTTLPLLLGIGALVAASALSALTEAATPSQTERVLYSFGNDPTNWPAPFGSVTFDSSGDLFGTTSAYGGDVYELSPHHGAWAWANLYHFKGGSDGSDPWAGVVFDRAGNLYGTTAAGGSSACSSFGCGTVFELTPSSGGGWTESVLYSFTGGADGSTPQAALAVDGAGNLYGTATLGGDTSCDPSGCGTVFELSRASGGWALTVLHTFAGRGDGAWPYFGTLVLDRAGNVYGTTAEIGIVSGRKGFGNVFELSRSRGGRWHETVLYRFRGGSDSGYPMAGLTFDATGNLYGTTEGYTTSHHAPGCCGSVYELQAASGGWAKSILHTFSGPDGAYPLAGVTLDRRRDLYGTTSGGGQGGECFIGCGVAFKLARSGGSWAETVLHDFGGTTTDGYEPLGPLTLERGRLYGTTNWGGSIGYGTVFEVAP
jgi:uncharacterized repeat protein (TIGR03803 family)